jgi:hypothetical protein
MSGEGEGVQGVQGASSERHTIVLVLVVVLVLDRAPGGTFLRCVNAKRVEPALGPGVVSFQTPYTETAQSVDAVTPLRPFHFSPFTLTNSPLLSSNPLQLLELLVLLLKATEPYDRKSNVRTDRTRKY